VTCLQRLNLASPVVAFQAEAFKGIVAKGARSRMEIRKINIDINFS